MSDPLELELQTVVNWHVGTGWEWNLCPLEEQSVLLTDESLLYTLNFNNNACSEKVKVKEKLSLF